MRVRAVSFQRLTLIVMNAVSGEALRPIGDLGRLMLVRKVIEEHNLHMLHPELPLQIIATFQR